MARNGSGTYTAPVNSVNPAVIATTIDQDDFNTMLDDLETALTESVARDGQTTTTAVVPFASGVKTDTIVENTSNSGVTVDGVILKDSNVTLNDTLIFDTGTSYTVQDSNGNEALIVGAVADAVNEITTENAVTGEAPEIQATGGDTNIGLDVITKGTGNFQINGVDTFAGPILGTEVDATNGGADDLTEVDFTSIPAWVKEIKFQFISFSTNGVSVPTLQLGTSGTPETSGYTSRASNITTTASTGAASNGFIVAQSVGADTVLHGFVTLALEDATNNTWVISGGLAFANFTAQSLTSGSKALAGTLDMIRLTTGNGTDLFDGGNVNILYS